MDKDIATLPFETVMDFKPVKSKRLYVLVVQQVLESIRNGKLKPGDRLPPENELAQMWRVSRPSIREALTALELLRVTESRPRRGTYVKADADIVTMLLPEALEFGAVEESPLDIIEARVAVEQQTATLAAERIEDDEIKEMSATLSIMEAQLASAGTFDMESDREFHLQVAGAAGNPVLFRLAHAVLALTKQHLWLEIRNRSHENPALPRKYHEQHRAILEALREHSADRASSLMREHLLGVERDIFSPQEPGD